MKLEDPMSKTFLITGANAGLGKDSARQLALLDQTEKIYLACRNEERALAAKQSLEELTGKSVFEVLLMDVSDLDSVRSAVASLAEPIDALIMNAGGIGGKTPAEITKDGVMTITAVNLLGHVALVDALLKAGKLTKVAVYAGSEASRGVARMGMKAPKYETFSVAEMETILQGSFFGEKMDTMVAYGYIKHIATLWMSAMARKHPHIRFVTVSPGGTKGTNVVKDAPALFQFLFSSYVGTKLMGYFGLIHDLEVGAKRYVDVVNDESFESGFFYASEKPIVTGPLVDQGTINEDFYNQAFQDHAHAAVHTFIDHGSAVEAGAEMN
jgi:NAD(P)-dependent dehydrogenase (short-subunit alcohol dehydrogenase family)